MTALAAKLNADALVLGHVVLGGGSVELVLVDGATGDAVAVLRRAGSARDARLGEHGLAMSGARRAMTDLAIALRTPPGQEPRIAAPAARDDARGESP